MSDGNSRPVDWWADPRIRMQLMMWVPPLLLFVKNRFHVHANLTAYTDMIVDLILAGGSVVGGALALRRRIKDGQNPSDPAPAIKTPGVVVVVKRLTNGG